MIRFGVLILPIIILLVLPAIAFGVERFPPPEFESGYELPVTSVQKPRANAYEYLDVAVLLLALSVASYLALKVRSRRGVYAMGIFSLLYFGFWRKGCVCSIGAIQNVSLALFNQSYSIPIAVVAFFMLPLVFTLFFGRTFCASVCPLGAVQDVVLIKPIKVPNWLESGLRVFPYLYLGGAILLASTSSLFIICEYDPFVAFFRRSGSLNILILGACFILIGLFVGRPYCRYLCPYSILLGWVSRASRWHVKINPDECIQCGLCADSCPFGAIQKPTQDEVKRREGKGRLVALMAILPVLIAIGSYIGFRAGVPLSRVNATVQLAERVWMEETDEIEEMTEASDAFRRTGQLVEELYEEASVLNGKFKVGGGLFGAFIGLILGTKLIQLSVRRRRVDYEVNRTTCLSCGRCFAYCPVGRKESKE